MAANEVVKIVLARVYDRHQPPGYRVLVDRLWPRGLTKEEASLDEWCRDLAPSTALRVWFGHDPAKWEAFVLRYTQELSEHQSDARALISRASTEPIVLLYGAKDAQHTHAKVLARFLRSLSG